MGRLAWSQVRFRPARTLALVIGVLVAAAAFTVLTAASRTAQLRTTGTVSANFAPAYDILVRPKEAGPRRRTRPARSSRTSCRASTAGSRWRNTTRSSRSRGSRSPRR